MYGANIKFLPARLGERYSSSLVPKNFSNKVLRFFGKIDLKSYIKSFIDLNKNQ